MSGATRGIYLERRVAEICAAHHYFTIRAAGSHGPADVVAIAPGPQVAFIQCKTDGNIRGDDWNTLWRLATDLGGVAVLAQWQTHTHRHITFLRITGEHPARSHKWPHMQWLPAHDIAFETLDPAHVSAVRRLELERLRPTPRKVT